MNPTVHPERSGREAVAESNGRKRVRAERAWVLCLIAVAAQSCGGVSVVTDKSSYALTSSIDVVLALANGTSNTRFYDLCGARLEQRTSEDTWSSAGDPGTVCQSIGRTVAPGFSVWEKKRLPSGLTAGTYRFVAFHFTESKNGEPIVPEEAPSNTFDLTAP